MGEHIQGRREFLAGGLTLAGLGAMAPGALAAWRPGERARVPGGLPLPHAAPPTFAANVPPEILTPNRVETRLLGTLNFTDGLPSDETVQKAYDFLDVARAVQAFHVGMPAASIEAAFEGLHSVGCTPGVLGITETLLDARSLFLTPNSTTVYAMMELNLKDGPVVVEVPPGVLGPVDDAYFRFVTDIGLTGPDQGRGGRYLFLHRDDPTTPTGGFHVVRSSTYRNLMFFRAFVRDGDTASAVAGVKAGFRCYPLAQAGDPPPPRFVSLSGLQFNTIHANTAKFFEELNAVVQYEPVDAFHPETVGLFAAIGIRKGHAFAPDARMQRLLAEGVAIGNASARAIAFRPRDPGCSFFPDRRWYSCFAGGSHEFISNGAMSLDGRTMFHYLATGITPAMASPRVGTGSVYLLAAHDAGNQYLDGARTYSVTLPAPIPINNFWSFVVYDCQTRSILETDQKLGGLDSTRPEVKPNPDGSYTLWFSPTPPPGKEGNWVQTMPGKAFFVLLRLYGPLQAWFDRTWKPGDFELA